MDKGGGKRRGGGGGGGVRVSNEISGTQSHISESTIYPLTAQSCHDINVALRNKARIDCHYKGQ